jgi:hypothetical protein
MSQGWSRMSNIKGDPCMHHTVSYWAWSHFNMNGYCTTCVWMCNVNLFSANDWLHWSNLLIGPWRREYIEPDPLTWRNKVREATVA